MTTPDTQAELDAFEKWANSQPSLRGHIDMYARKEWMWLAWQARASSAGSIPAHIVDLARKALIEFKGDGRAFEALKAVVAWGEGGSFHPADAHRLSLLSEIDDVLALIEEGLPSDPGDIRDLLHGYRRLLATTPGDGWREIGTGAAQPFCYVVVYKAMYGPWVDCEPFDNAQAAEKAGREKFSDDFIKVLPLCLTRATRSEP